MDSAATFNILVLCLLWRKYYLQK